MATRGEEIPAPVRHKNTPPAASSDMSIRMKMSRNDSRDSQTDSFAQGHWTVICCSLFSASALCNPIWTAAEAFPGMLLSPQSFAQTLISLINDTMPIISSSVAHSSSASSISQYLDNKQLKQNEKKKNISWTIL